MFFVISAKHHHRQSFWIKRQLLNHPFAGITFAALLLALAALTHAADTTNKNDARLLFDDTDKSVTIGGASLFYIGAIAVGLLLVASFLGLFGTTAKVAQPYDYASAT